MARPIRLIIASLPLCILTLSPVYANESVTYTLEEALQQTAKTHPGIKRQGEVVEQSKKRVNEALSEFLPHVSYNYQRGRGRERTTEVPWTDVSQENKELRVEQSLFAGGSHWAGLQRAELSSEATEHSYASSEQDTLAQAAAAYIQLYVARQIIQYTEQNLTALRTQLDITSSRYEAQDVTLTDLAQAKARLALSQADIASSTEQLRQAEAAFRRTVGIEPPAQLAEPTVLYPLPQTREELIAVVPKVNPRLQQAQLEERAAEKGVNVVRGELLPRASLIAYSRRSDDEGVVVGTDRFDQDAVRVNVSIPLYQGGGTWARFREAQHAAGEAKYAAMDIQREIMANAVRGWEAYKAAGNIKQASMLAADAANETLKGMRTEYDNGQRTLTDVLDAERELFSSQVVLARAEEQRMVNAYQLLALLNTIRPVQQTNE